MSNEHVFLNRISELGTLDDIVRKDSVQTSTVSLCSTTPASGLTTFLKHASRIYKKDVIALYIDGNYKFHNSLVSQIVLNLKKDYPHEINHLQRYVNDNFGLSDRRNLMGALIEGIPYVGPFFKHIVKSDDAIQICSSAYVSLVAEFISPFLRELSNHKKIVFFIDNAQEMDEWSLDLLRTTIGRPYKRLKYIIGIVKRAGDSTKQGENIVSKMGSLGYDINAFDFQPPSVELIKEICEYHNVFISYQEIGGLIDKNEGNLYEILTDIRRFKFERKIDFNPVQKEILGFLIVSQQPLRESDIIALLTRPGSPLFVKDIQEIYDGISSLANTIVEIIDLPDTDRLLALLPSSSPMNIDFQSSVTDATLYASSLYDYFAVAEKESIRHSKSELALLLYRLSKVVDTKNTASRGQTILSLSLKMGSIQAAENFVDKAVLDEHSYIFEDYLTKVAFYISMRSYGEALNLLNSPENEEWKRYRIYSVLKAVVLNRCKLNSESEMMISPLLQDSQVKEEKVLLLSFLISGTLHENNVSGARRIFQTHKDELKGALNYGYFIRNASSAFENLEGEILLKEALSSFEDSNDKFGFYSTLANLGNCQCRLNKLNDAEENLNEAYKNLEIYGIHHLHIVLNNLGICNLLMGRNDSAEDYFKRALSLAYNEMPKMFININIAALKILNNECEEALEIMQQMEDSVCRFIIDRARQMYFVNMAAFTFASSRDNDMIMHYCDKAMKHPDRMLPEVTHNRIKSIQKFIGDKIQYNQSMFLKLFVPCYLAYWYQNPLELFPQKLLSLKTASEN